jgi:ferredoxin
MDFISVFDEERCTRCGLCFNQCPLLLLDLSLAQKEIERLIDGEMTEEVLQRCRRCFACNFICPESANPLDLINRRWRELCEQ